MKNKKIKSPADWLELINGDLSPGDIVELPALSGSMMPLIIPGKKIKIKPQSANRIQVGDIIVFREGKSLTSHRLLIKFFLAGRMFLYQKGDSNRFGKWLKNTQVVGIVHFIENTGGKFIDITTASQKKQAKKAAFRQLFYTFGNIILIVPRKIKQWLIKI